MTWAPDALLRTPEGHSPPNSRWLLEGIEHLMLYHYIVQGGLTAQQRE